MKIVDGNRGRWRRVLLLGVGLVLGSACSGALADPLPGKPDAVHTMFNEAADSFDANNRMSLTQCAARTCNYVLTGDLAGIAETYNDDPERIGSFTLIFASGSDAASLVLSMGILMKVFSPDAGQPERGEALNALMAGMSAGQDDAIANIDGTRYMLKNLRSMGLWFIVRSQQ